MSDDLDHDDDEHDEHDDHLLCDVLLLLLAPLRLLLFPLLGLQHDRDSQA